MLRLSPINFENIYNTITKVLIIIYVRQIYKLGTEAGFYCTLPKSNIRRGSLKHSLTLLPSG